MFFKFPYLDLLRKKLTAQQIKNYKAIMDGSNDLTI